MESFALASQHSGSINHMHTIHLDASVVSAAREARLALTVVVVGWVAVTGIRTLWALGLLGQGREREHGGS